MRQECWLNLQTNGCVIFETTYQYDEKGRIVESRIGDRVTSITYEGDLSKIVGPTGAAWTVKSNDYGETERIEFPSGYCLYYKTDDKGNMEEISDDFGVLFRADAHSLEENIKGGTIHTEEARLTYDKKGRLVNVRDSIGNKARYQYDDDQHILRIKLPNGSELHRRVARPGVVVEEWAA